MCAESREAVRNVLSTSDGKEGCWSDLSSRAGEDGRLTGAIGARLKNSLKVIKIHEGFRHEYMGKQIWVVEVQCAF